MAQLRRLREMFPDELVVIGVHSGKFPSEQLTSSIRQAVMRLGIEHPVINDTGYKTWNAYAVRAWPTLVLIDPRGRIAGETSGEILAEDFATNITELIEQHADIIDRTPVAERLALRPDADLQPERPLAYPAKLLAAGERLFIADTGHHRVIEVRLDADGLSGEITRVFGSGEEGLRDGPAGEAAFNYPHGLGLSGERTLYVADTENHAIRAIDLESGVVRTVAGTGQKAHGRSALGLPTEMALRSPWAVLPVENMVLIAMAGSHQIWVLIDEQQIGPFAGNGYEALVDGPVAESSFNQPSDLALGLGYLFVADPEASAVRAISLNQTPATVTLVGQGLFDFGDQDGSTAEAMLQHPVGLAFAGQQVYVADTYNNKIKLLDPLGGQINTLIGSGLAGHRDGAFEQAELFEPEGVQALDGRLYIADTNNHLVRVADLQTRQVHTLRLRGLDRLLPAAEPAVEGERLQPVRVGVGQVRVALDARLPEGYKRNPDAPAVIRLGADGDGETRTFSFDASEPLTFTLDVAESTDLPLNLTLYYCQAEDAQLCLIADRRLVLPLQVVEGGPVEVRVEYPLGVNEGG